MCADCTTMSIGHIADLVAKGYDLDVATRLYRDSVVQTFLAGEKITELGADGAFDEMLSLIAIINQASQYLLKTQTDTPEVYESLLMVRTMLGMLAPVTDTSEEHVE